MGSAAVLTVATVLALVGGVLLAIAFGTNSWREFKVNRDQLSRTLPTEDLSLKDVYYSRSYGLFRKCFKDEQSRPPGIRTYKAPLGELCVDIGYDETVEDSMTDTQKEYVHLKRTYLALYVVGLALCVLALLFLIAGCGKRSSKLIIITGALLFIAAAFVAASIGVWHRVQFLIEEQLTSFGLGARVPNNDEYNGNWPQELVDATLPKFCWSYVVAWVGVGLVLLGSVAMCVAATMTKREKRKLYVQEEKAQMMYGYAPSQQSSYSYDKSLSTAVMPSYGYGGYPGSNYGYATYSPYAAAYSPYSYYGPYAYMHYYGYNNGNTLPR